LNKFELCVAERHNEPLVCVNGGGGGDDTHTHTLSADVEHTQRDVSGYFMAILS